MKLYIKEKVFSWGDKVTAHTIKNNNNIFFIFPPLKNKLLNMLKLRCFKVFIFITIISLSFICQKKGN